LQGLSVGLDSQPNHLMFADGEHGRVPLQGSGCAVWNSYSGRCAMADGGWDWTQLTP